MASTLCNKMTDLVMNQDGEQGKIHYVDWEIQEDDHEQAEASGSKDAIHEPVDRRLQKLSSFPFKTSSLFPSPPGSFYSAAQFLEAKRSFSNSEVSGVEDKDSCELADSPKKTSVYSSGTGSEESSSGSFDCAAYKPHRASDTRWAAVQAVRARNNGPLELKNFRILKRLGGGDIGTVHLAELIGTRTLFAVKVMDKYLLVHRRKTLRAQTEREILQSLDHPFLPTLYSHFETEKFSFLVMEFCPGGDLHSLRQKQPGKFFPEHAARFYLAEVLLALEYLHMLGIIYRDQKLEPKNSGGCVQPPCVLQPTCFSPYFLGKTKKPKIPRPRPRTEILAMLPELIAEPTNARSMSFVGTHEYLAPEIIKGEGHGSAVDWWTLGIFLYELLYGKTPFRGNANRATLFNVIGQPLRFPEAPSVSFAARDLIRGLLVKEPQHRLAYRRGAAEIKQHPFFQNVNWALIRCACPPDVPLPFDRSRAEAEGEAEAAGLGEGVDLKPRGDYYEIDFF